MLRKQFSSMERIGSLLPSLFNNLGIEDAVKLKYLRKKWSDIFGMPLSEHTFPREIREGELTVVVDSHAWLNELRLIGDSVVEKLKPFGISRVNFKYGKISKRKEISVKEQQQNSISEQQTQWISEVLKGISDQEIKSSIERVLKSYFVSINQRIRGEFK